MGIRVWPQASLALQIWFRGSVGNWVLACMPKLPGVDLPGMFRLHKFQYRSDSNYNRFGGVWLQNYVKPP